MQEDPASSIVKRIEDLDIGLFKAIPSQTSTEDKRSFLAVQRATGAAHGDYTYLEIGSHLGGSIQPHLLDRRCKKIYSIDPRPLQQPDDRSPNFIANYESNSTARMLSLLREVEANETDKIECFETEASKLDPAKIAVRPHIALIDGEHTRRAVLADFEFCLDVISPDGVILFHDFTIIYPAIVEICRSLKGRGLRFVPLMLDGEVFGVFFDAATIHADAMLKECFHRKKHFLLRYRVEQYLRQNMPKPLRPVARVLRRIVTGGRASGAQRS